MQSIKILVSQPEVAEVLQASAEVRRSDGCSSNFQEGERSHIRSPQATAMTIQSVFGSKRTTGHAAERGAYPLYPTHSVKPSSPSPHPCSGSSHPFYSYTPLNNLLSDALLHEKPVLRGNGRIVYGSGKYRAIHPLLCSDQRSICRRRRTVATAYAITTSHPQPLGPVEGKE